MRITSKQKASGLYFLTPAFMRFHITKMKWFQVTFCIDLSDQSFHFPSRLNAQMLKSPNMLNSYQDRPNTLQKYEVFINGLVVGLRKKYPRIFTHKKFKMPS